MDPRIAVVRSVPRHVARRHLPQADFHTDALLRPRTHPRPRHARAQLHTRPHALGRPRYPVERRAAHRPLRALLVVGPLPPAALRLREPPCVLGRRRARRGAQGRVPRAQVVARNPLDRHPPRAPAARRGAPRPPRIPTPPAADAGHRAARAVPV